MATVLVVDDSSIDRELVGRILAADTSLSIETAQDGVRAFERIKNNGVDVVVTDLQMPEMDGLELVTTVRIHNPDIPVVLMTAHGSEQLAVEALEKGATSYVPKPLLQDKLLDTVQDMLVRVHADHTYERLMGCQQHAEFRYTLDNDPSLIDPLVDLVQQIVVGMGLCDTTGGYRVGVALKEAMLNAVYRGNLEITAEQLEEEREQMLVQGPGAGLVERRRAESPYCDRKVHVDVRIGGDAAQVTVRDEGPGFDASAVPTDLESERGRGLMLMKMFMDDVRFNDTGNEITLVKKREQG